MLLLQAPTARRLERLGLVLRRKAQFGLMTLGLR
jgi:hypothetical protein